MTEPRDLLGVGDEQIPGVASRGGWPVLRCGRKVPKPIPHVVRHPRVVQRLGATRARLSS